MSSKGLFYQNKLCFRSKVQIIRNFDNTGSKYLLGGRSDCKTESTVSPESSNISADEELACFPLKEILTIKV